MIGFFFRVLLPLILIVTLHAVGLRYGMFLLNAPDDFAFVLGVAVTAFSWSVFASLILWLVHSAVKRYLPL